MSAMAFVAAALAALVLLVAVHSVHAALRAYKLYGGIRVMACPESGQTAAMEVDALHAALTAALGRPRLRLRSCSRWPERRDCGSDCVKSFELAPEEGLARTILTRWYRERSCVFCGNPFGEIQWSEFEPGLVSRDGRTFECSEVPVEILPDVLATHKPVCWSCHVVETFRRANPDVFVDHPALGGERRHDA